MKQQILNIKNLMSVEYDGAMDEYALEFKKDGNTMWVRVDARDHENAKNDGYYFDNEEVINQIISDLDVDKVQYVGAVDYGYADDQVYICGDGPADMAVKTRKFESVEGEDLAELLANAERGVRHLELKKEDIEECFKTVDTDEETTLYFVDENEKLVRWELKQGKRPRCILSLHRAALYKTILEDRGINPESYVRQCADQQGIDLVIK